MDISDRLGGQLRPLNSLSQKNLLNFDEMLPFPCGFANGSITSVMYSLLHVN